jgi:hypothetical protein
LDAVRRALDQGRLPDPSMVRTGEIADAFGAEDLTAPAEGAPTPFAPGERYRLVRLQVPGWHGRISDVWREVEWNPQVVERYRRVGTALYEVELRPGRAGRVATVRLRWSSPQGERASETTLTTSQIAPSWEKASPALRRSAMAAELAEVLAGPPGAQRARLDALLREARKVAAELPGDPRAEELADVVGRAVAVVSGGGPR